MVTPDAVPPRSNNIDALRLLLAVLVVFSHGYPLAMGDYRAEPLVRWSRGQITLGEVAVHWFFALSGYLITQSWERSRSPWSFLRKRVARIYPGYLVAVAVGVVLVAPLARGGSGGTTPAQLIQGITRGLMLGGIDSTGTFATNPFPGAVNGSLWTIPFEFSCYLLVAILGIAGLLRRRVMLASFGAGLVVAAGFAVGGSAAAEGRLGVVGKAGFVWAWVLPCFLAGSLVYGYRERFTWRLHWAIVAALGMVAACRIPHGVALAMPTLGTYLLFYLAFTPRWSWPGASRYGDLSYGTYLYSYPIQQAIVQTWGPAIGPWGLFACALVPALGAGFLSWHLVERRWLERQHHRRASIPISSPGLGAVSRSNPGVVP